MKLERIEECYEFYKTFQYQIPELLSISTFIRKNQVDITNISSILKGAKDLFHLQLYRSEIKNEIEILKQTKNNYSLNQTIIRNQQPVPLGPLPKYYKDKLEKNKSKYGVDKIESFYMSVLDMNG